MRVLFVTYLEFPLEIGGFQNQVRNIADKLMELGADVDWYRTECCDIESYDIIHVFSSVPSLCPIVKKAKDCEKPVVLTPMLGSRKRSNSYYRSVMRLSRIPHVFAEYRYLRYILSAADHITPLTEFEKKRICRIAGVDNSKVTPIPNGISEPFFEDTIEEVELPFEDYVLVVGRIEENKNQLTAIKLANQYGFNLILVGEPAIGSNVYYQECKRMAGQSVCFWGKESNTYKLKFLYKNAAVTAIPSFSEMAPLVVFESLKLKTPVVCTDRCSLVGDNINGLFFSDISSKSLRKTFDIAMNYNRKSIDDTGIFSWRDVAIRYHQVYENVLMKSTNC